MVITPTFGNGQTAQRTLVAEAKQGAIWLAGIAYTQ